MKQELKAVNFYKRALENGCAQGLRFDGSLSLCPDGDGAGNYVSRVFDTGEAQCTFHRLVIDGRFDGVRLEVIAAALDTLEWTVDNAIVELPEYLADPDIEPARKRRVLISLPHVRAVDSPDILLHAVKGRYIWLNVTLVPEGKAGSRPRLDGMRLEFPKVCFTEYFPEIYQGNGFFERYISIFQSVYLDTERRVDGLPALLDYESTPEENVNLLAGWLGLENPAGLCTPEQMRHMIARLDLYQGARGTLRALEALLRLVTKRTPYIIEHFRWDTPELPEARRALYSRLYGESSDSFCVLLPLEEGETPPFGERELERLAESGCLLGTRCRVVFLRRISRTDTYCYLGINSALSQPEAARADGALLGAHITVG